MIHGEIKIHTDQNDPGELQTNFENFNLPTLNKREVEEAKKYNQIMNISKLFTNEYECSISF